VTHVTALFFVSLLTHLLLLLLWPPQITFSLPNSGGANSVSIAVTSQLPWITDAVHLRGDTQPDGAWVVIDGSQFAGGDRDSHGLVLAQHSGSRVQNLTLRGFPGAGIRLTESRHVLVDVISSQNRVSGVIAGGMDMSIISGRFEHNRYDELNSPQLEDVVFCCFCLQIC
jgi:hypothetical protein